MPFQGVRSTISYSPVVFPWGNRHIEFPKKFPYVMVALNQFHEKRVYRLDIPSRLKLMMCFYIKRID